MLRSGKGALLLLAVAVFWSALPLGACLLAGQASGEPACCMPMAQDCPMQSADMNSPCCQIHSEDSAVVPEVPFAPEHVRLAALAPQAAAAPILAASADAIRYAREASPPGAPPGAISVLRI